MEKVKIGKHHFVLSNEKPKQGDCYLCITTDSTGVKLMQGVRLQTDNDTESHKNCIKILATDHKGLNLSGCPTLEGFTL
jgi:hypothetical protein